MEWSWNPRPLLAVLDCCLSWLGKDTGLDLSSQVSRAVCAMSSELLGFRGQTQVLVLINTSTLPTELPQLKLSNYFECRFYSLNCYSDPRGLMAYP